VTEDEMTERPISEDELHAYVDGELPPERHSAVEAWLAANPEDRARVAAWRDQIEVIRVRFGAIATEPPPDRFDIRKLVRAGARWKKWSVLAATLALLIGAAGGWFARGEFGLQGRTANSFERFTAEALDAYKVYVVEVRHPVEVPGSEHEHLVQWLSKRVGYPLRLPNLESVGLKLVGGRLLPGPTGAAAFFMYEGPSGERYTLYTARSSGRATALRYDANGPASAVYWANDNIAYVVSGEGDRGKLRQVATTAYEQLDGEAAKRSAL
jgi:anti-sigma factor RsiW